MPLNKETKLNTRSQFYPQNYKKGAAQSRISCGVGGSNKKNIKLNLFEILPKPGMKIGFGIK